MFDAVLSRAVGQTIPELDVVLLVLVHLILSSLVSLTSFPSEFIASATSSLMNFCLNISNVASMGVWFKVFFPL